MENSEDYFLQIKKNLFSKFEKYRISYKNGFYRIPNLSNTPETIIGCFDRMLFCKHNKEESTLSSDTIFCKAKSYYFEIEPGWWIFHTSANYKKNVAFEFKLDPSIEANYYVVKLYYQKPSLEKTMLIKGMPQPCKVWSVFKCNVKIDTFHFKNTHDISIMMHFNKEWLKNKMKKYPQLEESGFLNFLNSKNPFLLLNEEEDLINYFSSRYLKYLQMDKSDEKRKKIRQLSIAFFDCFLEKYKNENIDKSHFEIDEGSRRMVYQAKEYLMQYLPAAFPGIENISTQMGISPTKLKHDFKIILQQSIFQFYRAEQMKIAHQSLLNGGIMIKDLASQMGYTSVGKFSTAFKNQFGLLPSEISKNK